MRTPPGRRNRQNAALAFDHDIARVGRGRRHQRDSPALGSVRVDPFISAARLAGTAAGEVEPGPPVTRRRWRSKPLVPRDPFLPTTRRPCNSSKSQRVERCQLGLEWLRGEPLAEAERSEKFCDEHRAALNWLNQMADKSARFFGLEIELWRIGEFTGCATISTLFASRMTGKPQFVMRRQP